MKELDYGEFNNIRKNHIELERRDLKDLDWLQSNQEIIQLMKQVDVEESIIVKMWYFVLLSVCASAFGVGGIHIIAKAIEHTEIIMKVLGVITAVIILLMSFAYLYMVYRLFIYNESKHINKALYNGDFSYIEVENLGYYESYSNTSEGRYKEFILKLSENSIFIFSDIGNCRYMHLNNNTKSILVKVLLQDIPNYILIS